MSTTETPSPIWSRPEPGERNARFSRDKIAAAALEIAKKDGVGAISMRRVAADLGAGTMTLYHYVKNKRELTELMLDAMMAQLLVPEEELEKGWREGLTAIAHASLAAWRTHRWQREEITGTPVFGPNGMRHFEQSLRAAAATGLPFDRRMEIVSQVDEYVLGYAEGEFGFSHDDLDSWKREWGEYMVGVSDYLQAELDAGDFPNIERFMDGDDFSTVVERMVREYSDEGRFDRGLKRILDGVQVEIDAAGQG